MHQLDLLKVIVLGTLESADDNVKQKFQDTKVALKELLDNLEHADDEELAAIGTAFMLQGIDLLKEVGAF